MADVVERAKVSRDSGKEIDDDTLQRATATLWRGLPVREAGKCWEWDGCRSRGYGLLSVRGRSFKAHRVSWSVHFGPIADGIDICHHCDNPPCCNPAHLFAGTAKDNALDARRKGLVKIPWERGCIPHNSLKTHCIHGHPFSGQNLRIDGYGRRQCRACQKEHGRRDQLTRVRDRRKKLSTP